MQKKVRCFSIVVVVIMMLTTVFTNVSFAATEISDLKSGKLLDKSDVLKIARYHVSSYIKSDIQTKGKNIELSNDFINLYDFDDNLFAYIVPLNEVEKGEIGYITVGAIEDGYGSYLIFIDKNAVSDIRQILKNKKKNSNDKNTYTTKLIFLPPMNYIVKVENNNNNEYFDISDNKDENITNEIVQNFQDIKNIYKKIRNEENKKQIEKMTENTDKLSTVISVYSITPLATVPSEDVRLVNEAQGKFVPVVKTSTSSYYGGDQGWWSSTDPSKVNNGCGPTAAANVTCYLARKSSTKYGKLYTPSSMSKTDFLKHMTTSYNYIKPGSWGATSLSDWTSKVEKYASGKGVSLTRVTSSAPCTLDNTATYIKNGLKSDCPVATLNLKFPNTGYDFAWHWMTITKYFRDTADNRWIAVSSWGSRYSINYRTHFDAMKKGGGLMYFK